MLAHLGTPRDPYLGRDYRMFADSHIVGNLDEVINFRAALNDRLAQSRAIYCGIRANLNVIFHHDNAHLWNLDAILTAAGIAEAIAANHRTGMHDHAITHTASVPNYHVGMKYAIGSNLNSLPNIYTGVKHRVAADPSLSTYKNIRENCNPFLDKRRGVNRSLGTARLRELDWG